MEPGSVGCCGPSSFAGYAGNHLDTHVRRLSDEDGLGLIDAQTQKHLGVAAREFGRRWGPCLEYTDSEHPNVRHLAVLIPHGRPDPT